MCLICGKPVDRSEFYVAVTYSVEIQRPDRTIAPVDVSEVGLLHNACGTNRKAAMKAAAAAFC
jgi:hypothetical protein